MKLVQKHIYKGTRTFELLDDAVNVHIDTPFLDNKFTVVLSILDPEPVVKGSDYAFVSVVNREPLLEMFLNKPNREEFEAFVKQLRQRVIEEDYGKPKSTSPAKSIDPANIQEAIDLLRLYINGDDLEPFLNALEALKQDPGNGERFDDMFRCFNELGPMQGAVLTYAPYINFLLVDDIPDSGGPG
jgi:hypothetical protein